MQELEILKSVAEEGKNNAIDLVKRRLSNTLSENLEVLYRQIKERGFAIVPGFLSAQDCETIKAWMEHTLSTNPKIWKDSVESDHRIFFANTASPQVNAFYTHEMITNVLSTYEKTTEHAGFTLANKVVYKANNPGSGGGWHRDFVKRKQTKAIVYLNDVSEKNGPFQFIAGTHLFKKIVHYQREFGFKYNQFRFADLDIEKIVSRYPELLYTATGKAGSLILVDTRGIHRGKPIEEGIRYALTNYYWFKGSIPAHIRKLNPFT
ncbi:MAG: phytanoyl-CoA dioxygenase family protein [Cyclobacteriaceae bacterium]|nr:phytanoyl-CoA dioxygenase family protein [Cyclobacteriaceae bacterium]